MDTDVIGIDHPPASLQPPRKRKAESQANNNERLSKRLSLLNLGEQCLTYLPKGTLLVLVPLVLTRADSRRTKWIQVVRPR